MMKKMMMMKSFCAALSLVAFAACSDNDDLSNGTNPGSNGSDDASLATVNFELSADAAGSGTLTKALSEPVYTKDGFRILAFKEKDDNKGTFVYSQDVPLSTLTYDGDAKKLSGQVQLPIGTYKFISMYGIPGSDVMTMPALTNMPLSENLLMTHQSNGVLPSIFLDVNTLDAIPSYDLGLTSPGTNKTVTSKINRAVGRVDLLFVRTDAAHTPISGDNVFGTDASNVPNIKSIELDFGAVKQTMDLTGHVTAGAMDHTYNISFPDKALTMGTGAAMKLGEDGYVNYDNVVVDDIINGSAHVSGAYLIPESDENHVTTLSMTLTPVSGTPRTINIATPIPLKRNYVTLIKVYVMGDNVFTTGVDFAVEIDPTWAGSLSADVEVK